MRTLLLATLAAMTIIPAVAVATPLPGANGETTEQIPAIGRLFPEALQTNDYIGYFEAIASFEKLNTTYPDRIEFLRAGKSYGLLNAVTQQVDHLDVLVVEVTNEKSATAFADKIHLVFTCSVHGNEKGGREGCMRVAEDFAKGIGLAAATPELVPLLDFMVIALVFPNVDGWAHDEPEYLPTNPGPMYTRENGNGSDLNRQWPTLGYLETDQSHKTMAEPEVAALGAYMKARYTNTWYALDIHGMLNPADGASQPPVPGNCGPESPEACPATATDFQTWLQKPNKGHFVLGLLASQELDQDEFIRQTRMAELIRERVSGCPGTLGPAWCSAPSTGAWGGAYNFWGTSYETIGYTSTGTGSMFMMNPYGLNAPAASYEMAYNHMVCDGVYMGCGNYMNEFHVNNVRQMVRALMEAASIDFRVSLETNGLRTAYLYNPKLFTTAGPDGGPRDAGGWSDENDRDDQWDIKHQVFQGSPMDYLRDIRRFVRDGDKPGVFEELPVNTINAETLKRFDQFIVAGTAHEILTPEHVATLNKWVEEGGRLILTDSALQVMEQMGVTAAGTITQLDPQYVGLTEVINYEHPISSDLLGYSRQTYDPVTIGYPQGASPVWAISANEVSAKGIIVGVVPAAGPVETGASDDVNLGEVAVGKGSIRFLGALLPDPLLEHYTPYGIGGYGVTYAGNQFFTNMLDLDQVYEAPPTAFDDVGSLRKPGPEDQASQAPGATTDSAGAAESDTPAPGVTLLALTLVGTALALRRRKA